MSSVDHPAHYVDGGYECIEVMKSIFGENEVKIFCKLNAFKYLWRCNHKHADPGEDIEKAGWYLHEYTSLWRKDE